MLAPLHHLNLCPGGLIEHSEIATLGTAEIKAVNRLSWDLFHNISDEIKKEILNKVSLECGNKVWPSLSFRLPSVQRSC